MSSMQTTACCMVMLTLLAGTSACGNNRRHLMQEAVKPKTGLVQPGTNSGNAGAARDLTRTYAAVMAGSTYSKPGLAFTNPDATNPSEETRVALPSALASTKPSSTTKEAAVLKPTEAAVQKTGQQPAVSPTAKASAGLVWPGPIRGEEHLPRP